MKSIELFAGIGGIALAAEWAGIETVAFCERDPFCQKVLNKHWPNIPIFDDVRILNRKTLEEKGVIEPNGTIDIISGGFPCQPYSSAGYRKGKEDDRDLWPEMFRIIQELKPSWVIGENVANFINMELERTCTDLESEGYETQAFIIPAAGVDAKHQRYRTFVVAYSNSIGCMEQKGQQEEIQQSKLKELQPEKSKQSILSKSLYVCDENGVNACGSGWRPESGVDRVVDGIPDGVDRIRSLGNAVVPQQIYPIFKCIMEIEDGN